MRTVVLRDSEWYRGHGSGMSALVRKSDGKQCCLGVEALDRGIPRECLLGHGIPSNLVPRLGSSKFEDAAPAVAQYVLDWNKSYDPATSSSDLRQYLHRPLGLQHAVAQINDGQDLDDETRVRYLNELFAANNITLVFDPNS